MEHGVSTPAESRIPMEDSELHEISRRLSWILRHGGKAAGVSLNPRGWAKIKDILGSKYMENITQEKLHEVINRSNQEKLRYDVTTDNAGMVMVRCVGGHTLSRVKKVGRPQ